MYSIVRRTYQLPASTLLSPSVPMFFMRASISFSLRLSRSLLSFRPGMTLDFLGFADLASLRFKKRSCARVPCCAFLHAAHILVKCAKSNQGSRKDGVLANTGTLPQAVATKPQVVPQATCKPSYSCGKLVWSRTQCRKLFIFCIVSVRIW